MDIAGAVRSLVGEAAVLAFDLGVVKAAFSGRGGERDEQQQKPRPSDDPTLPPIVREAMREQEDKAEKEDAEQRLTNSWLMRIATLLASVLPGGREKERPAEEPASPGDVKVPGEKPAPTPDKPRERPTGIRGMLASIGDVFGEVVAKFKTALGSLGGASGPPTPGAKLSPRQKGAAVKATAVAAGASARAARIAGGMVAVGAVATKVLSGVATAALATYAAFVSLPNILNQFGRLISENNRQFTQYSGQIAASFAGLDQARLRRSIDMARQTSDSTATANRSLDRAEQARQPLDVIGKKAANIFATATNTLSEKLSNIGNTISEALGINDALDRVQEMLDAVVKANKDTPIQTIAKGATAELDKARRARRLQGGFLERLP